MQASPPSSTFPSSVATEGVQVFLLPLQDDALSLDIDLFQRYWIASRLLERMVTTFQAAVGILEIGPNYLNPLPRFVNPRHMRLTRCDVAPVSRDADFVQVRPGEPLPFADEAFDAVVALEVLEHMPADRRRGFLSECLRVARHGVIFSCPNGVPEVAEAEALANASYQRRHGKPHPYLQEHQDHGLPREQEVLAMLREFEVPHAVLDNAPLDVWLAMLLLSENLLERQAAPDLQQRLNQSFFRERPASRPIPYRKIYVCAKTFDATAALEPLTDVPFASTADPASPGTLQTLHYLATASCDALHTLEQAQRQERVAQQTERGEWQAQVNSLKAEMLRLRAGLTAGEADLMRWSRRHVLLNAHVRALTESRSWKLGGGLRALQRLLRPRGFDGRHLIPFQQLVRSSGADGVTWQSAGPEAHFVVPCFLPAGWLRIRLKMSSDCLACAELAFDACDNAGPVHVERVPVHGRTERELFIQLPRSVLGVHFTPLDVPGRFQVEQLEVTPVPPPQALAHALRTKLALLAQHRLLPRALGNGLKLLARGRFRDIGHKLLNAFDHARKHKSLDAPTANETVTPRRRQPALAQRLTADKPLDIVYVLKTAGLCGGVKVVLEHVSRLHARGHNVCVYYLEGSLDWFARPVPACQFPNVEALKQALARFRGIKVATWFETAPWVAASLQPGDRGYYLIQDIEESYCNSPAEVSHALGTYNLGLKPISEGLWVHRQLQQRFGQESVFVSIGLELDLFQPRLVMRDPLRILTQARTWSGGGPAGARLKGWDTAQQTILRCHELNPRMKLATFSIEDPPSFPAELRHDHYRNPSDEHLAELYSQAGVYLLTSTHEGFGLTAAEAMACGCPVVATLAQGNEEFCIDGLTALTAPAGDVEQLAHKCLLLQQDSRLAAELGNQGRNFILNYTWDRVIDRLEREFLQREGPEIALPEPAAAVERPHEGDDLARLFREREEGADQDAPRAHLDGEYPDLQLAASTLEWSIVIPTINNAALVAECIASCRRFVPSGTSLQFIVVDDGTRNRAILDELRRSSQELNFQLLYNHQNLGFSASVNHGMRHARGRYVVLCNNDVVFFQPWLESLTQAFDADPRLGIVGAKLLYPNGAIQHAGVDKVPGQMLWHHAFGQLPGDHPPAGRSRYVWSVTGALFAIRRSTLQQLGGFSTAYATAYEDLDYCLNAWTHGCRVGYCSDVVAYHLEGTTRGANATQKNEHPLWTERERAGHDYFLKKWSYLRHVENFQTILPPREDTPSYQPAAYQPAAARV